MSPDPTRGGDHLDDIGADQLGPAAELAARPEEIGGGHPARLGRPGARREGRVEDVHVNRQEHRPVAAISVARSTTDANPELRTSCMKRLVMPCAACQANSGSPGQ